MKLSQVHLISPAHIGGSPQSMLSVTLGWDLELRPEILGIIATSVSQDIETWIPLSNCKNGYVLDETAPVKKAKQA